MTSEAALEIARVIRNKAYTGKVTLHCLNGEIQEYELTERRRPRSGIRTLDEVGGTAESTSSSDDQA